MQQQANLFEYVPGALSSPAFSLGFRTERLSGERRHQLHERCRRRLGRLPLLVEGVTTASVPCMVLIWLVQRSHGAPPLGPSRQTLLDSCPTPATMAGMTSKGRE